MIRDSYVILQLHIIYVLRLYRQRTRSSGLEKSEFQMSDFGIDLEIIIGKRRRRGNSER